MWTLRVHEKFIRKKLACTYYFMISKEGAHMYKAGRVEGWRVLGPYYSNE